MRRSSPRSNLRWRSRSLKPEGRKTGSILQSPYSPRSWYAVTAAVSSAPRSGTPPTSTAVSYGSATTSSNADEKCSTPHIREGVIKEVFIKALNSIVTDKGPALYMMNHLKAKVDDTATLEEKLEKAAATFDDKMVLLQDYISKNAITEKELADGRYAELEKEYREAQAEKVKLQDELTERRRRSLMIGWFIDEVSVFEDLFTEFSENLWLGLVDVMVVVDKKNFRVKFKSGMEVPVEL